MATTIPTITAPPSVPSRSDPINFDSRADAFLGWMEHPFADEINAAIAGMNTLGNEMVSLRDETQTLKNQTETIQNNVLALVNVTIWVDTKTYNPGENVSASNGLTYRAIFTNTNDNPVTSTTGNWVAISTFPPTIIAETSNRTLSATDLSGNFTITNRGSSSEITFTWPNAVINQKIRFFVIENQYLKVTAPAGISFRLGANLSATGGYIRSDVVGSWIELECDGTEIITFNFEGRWNWDQ